jgi:hypothetical protein
VIVKLKSQNKTKAWWLSREEKKSKTLALCECLWSRPCSEGGDADMPSSQATVIDEGTPERMKQTAAKKRNAVAMANLTMAFETDGVMALVYESVTSAWRSGLAHLIVTALFKKYQPKDTMTRVE